MLHQNYQQGMDTALAQFGVKQASSLIKTLLVGDPGKYWKQLQSGKLFRRGGMIAKAMDPVMRDPAIHPVLRGLGTAANTAFLYGLPAYGVYEAMQAPSGHRGSSTGVALGSVLGGIIGMPLGLVGNMAGSRLGGALGEALGRNFNRDDRRSSQRAHTHRQQPLSEEMASVTRRPSS